MHEQAGLFSDIVIVFVAVFAGGFIARALLLPAIMGYMVAGVAIGPHAFGLIHNADEVQSLAEFGVVLLLFTVGVEISLADLRRAGWRVLVAGGGQIVGTALVGYLLGLGLGWPTGQSAALGMALSLSSTMVVLKTLMDRGELGALYTRVMTGVLVLQDLAFIPMIALLPVFAGNGGSLFWELGVSTGKAAAVLAVAFIAGGRVIPWLLRRVAVLGSRETFVITVVAITFASAAATSSVGLSAALGAFVAGLVVSETDWAGHQALQEVGAMRDIFGALFFAALGMLTSPAFLLDNALTIALVVAAAVAVKFALVTVLVRAVGYLPNTATRAGAGLVQLGEFSFILAAAAAELGLADDAFLPTVIATALLTMAATPLIITGASRLVGGLETRYRILRREPVHHGPHADEVSGRIPELHGHVIVAGLGRIGTFVADELNTLHIPHIGVDIDPVAAARVYPPHGFAIQGDAALVEVLRQARLEHARLLILTVTDPVSALVTVQHARRMHPELPIIGRVGYREEAEALRALGVDEVVWPEMEAALEVMRSGLRELGVERALIAQIVRSTRERLAFGEDQRPPDDDPYAGAW
ncbi:MAG: cation:proton antiporter [Chloroflexota bacterium]